MRIQQKLTRRRFLAAVGGVLASSAIAACSPKASPTQSVVKETVPVVQTKVVEKVVTATPGPKPAVEPLEGTLTIAKYAESPNADGSKSTGQLLWEKIYNAYKEAQPKVKIEEIFFPQGASPDEVYQWVKTRQAAHQVPTLVNSTADHVTPAQEAAGKAPWVPLDPYLMEVNPYTGNIWRDDQDYNLLRWRSSLKGTKYIYGMTPTRYKAAWMYNKTLFERLGLKEPATWSEWFALNDALKAQGIIPIARPGGAFFWSHTTWVLFGALGRRDWNEMAGPGNDFPPQERKLEWVICGKWRQDRPWVREGYEAIKKLTAYCPDGFMGMNADQTNQLFMQGKAAMMYVDQGWLRIIDEARKANQIDFDVDAFPTPRPDEGVFSKEVLEGAAPIADDGENYGAWLISAAEVRLDKSENQVKMGVDFLRFLTVPEIQKFFVEDLLNLPTNPNVKFTDPRIASWMKNPEQISYKWLFFGDRPTWYQYFQAYVGGQMTLDQFIKASEEEIKNFYVNEAKESNIVVKCS